MVDAELIESVVPPPNAPVGNPATASTGRDLHAEKLAEAAREQQAAKSKEERFRVKKTPSSTRPMIPAAPEYESIILRTAANNPLADLTYPVVSAFIPNLSVIFYVLNNMDTLMCNTRKWTENCSGWVPPISQMFFSVLAIYQIIRAMDATGSATPDMVLFLETFERIFPTADLWIPGPLVAAFRALAAFRPDANDLFAGVTVGLDTEPGFSALFDYILNGPSVYCLPNVSIFLSRLRSICNTASSPNMTEAIFAAHLDGPRNVSSLFGNPAAQSQFWTDALRCPGASFMYGGNLQLWANAARLLSLNSIPVDLNAAHATHVSDSWTGFLRLEGSEFQWFAPVAASMAKYCQYWNGSTPLSDISPTASAAGAVKLRSIAPTSLYDLPTFTAGNPTATPVINPSYALRSSARLVLDAQVALRDIPDAHVMAGLTFAINQFPNATDQTIGRLGPFWDLGPNVKDAHSVELLPGMLQSIAREYHRDTRQDAHRQ